jgi:osmotically inducible lipoprotein OsmB
MSRIIQALLALGLVAGVAACASPAPEQEEIIFIEPAPITQDHGVEQVSLKAKDPGGRQRLPGPRPIGRGRRHDQASRLSGPFPRHRLPVHDPPGEQGRRDETGRRERYRRPQTRRPPRRCRLHGGALAVFRRPSPSSAAILMPGGCRGSSVARSCRPRTRSIPKATRRCWSSTSARARAAFPKPSTARHLGGRIGMILPFACRVRGFARIAPRARKPLPRRAVFVSCRLCRPLSPVAMAVGDDKTCYPSPSTRSASLLCRPPFSADGGQGSEGPAIASGDLPVYRAARGNRQEQTQNARHQEDPSSPQPSLPRPSLSGCVTSDLERAGIGAAAGGLTAAAFDGNIGTGIIIGAAGGALCDDAGLC